MNDFHSSTPRDHDELVERASQGDRDACSLLLERHLTGLRAFVRGRLGRMIRAKESTSDIVQSVCAEAFAGMEQIEKYNDVSFRNWLYRQAERKIQDKGRFYRRERRDAAREIPLPAPSDSTWNEGNVAGTTPAAFTGSRHALAREELAQVEEAFQKLRKEDREVILLSRIVGLSHVEIAQRFKQSPGAIRTRLSRALARLTTLLNQQKKS